MIVLPLAEKFRASLTASGQTKQATDFFNQIESEQLDAIDSSRLAILAAAIVSVGFSLNYNKGYNY